MAKKKHKAGLFLRFRMMAVRARLFLANPNVQFVLGLICIAFTIFLASSFLSFFSSGAGDQTVVESVVSDEVAGNASGKGGAAVANYFINRCFG